MSRVVVFFVFFGYLDPGGMQLVDGLTDSGEPARPGWLGIKAQLGDTIGSQAPVSIRDTWTPSCACHAAREGVGPGGRAGKCGRWTGREREREREVVVFRDALGSGRLQYEGCSGVAPCLNTGVGGGEVGRIPTWP